MKTELTRLLFLLAVPGFFAELLSGRTAEKEKTKIGSTAVYSLLFDYILFLTDVALIYFLLPRKYEKLLAILSRRAEAVEDVYLLALFWLIQLLLAVFWGFVGRLVRYGSIEKALKTIRLRQGRIIKGTLIASFAVFLIAFCVKDYAEQQLLINEVCSKNNGVLADENWNYGDYVELYNPSGMNLRLEGFFISDDEDRLDKKELGDLLVPAGGYCVVQLQSEDGFGISSKGETVYLTAPGGGLLDSVALPPLAENMAYARREDGAEAWMEQLPTPSEENDRYGLYVAPPSFSAESGFYEQAFLLELTAGEGDRIYYTLDSSVPDENSELYTGGIEVKNVCDQPCRYRRVPNVTTDWHQNDFSGDQADQAFVVRAVAVDGWGNKSQTVTRVYFVDMDQYRDRYVLSLISDPDDLFGDNGIYVTGKDYDDWYLGRKEEFPLILNYMEKGREWEIATDVALFRGDLLMEQRAGMRIQGASEREGRFKRFSLFARKAYSGSRYFEYELFGERMHSFFMRSDYEDAFVQSLAQGRDVGTLKAVPASVFLDGEFWYDTYLREKYSEDFLAAAYGVNRENVQLEEAAPEEIYSFLDEHDLSREEDFLKFCEMIDLQSYIDHLAANIYLCNMDGSESKNYRLWKTRTDEGTEYGDGRWRWLLYDMDCVSWNSIAYYQALRYNIDSFAQTKEFAGQPYNQERIYKALRVNGEFCRQFVLTFMDMANTNFRSDVVAEKIVDYGRDMTWNDGFFANRFDGIVPALAKEFDLTGTLEEITLGVSSPEAGSVRINTAFPDLTGGDWTGRYYTDYPVTLEAVPAEGYEFVEWRCGGDTVKTPETEVWLTEGGCRWEAVFQVKGRK